MKKIFKFLLVFSLSILFILGSRMDAYAASASLSGPSTVRAGDTITLKLKVSDDGKYGLEGTLNYDSSQVSFSGVSCELSGWKAENSGNALIAYDDALSKPLSGSKTVLTLKFKVKSDVEPGTKITISIGGIVTTDGSTESSLGKASYSVTTAAPLSENANLKSLSVAEGELSPSFAAGTTSYKLGEVDYSVSKLDISYKTEDSKATVSVKGNQLSVGKNTVSIVVTAENGDAKTYKISVTRKQDPNYVASSNAALSAVKLNQGTISPTFSSEITEYVVYLPYESEGTKFTASGTAEHSKAQSVTSGTIDVLKEGVNSTEVVCKAEDGSEKSYQIHVVVMPKYTGGVPEADDTITVEPETQEPTEAPSEEPTEVPTEESTEGNTEADTEENSQAEQNTEGSSDADNTEKGGTSMLLPIVIILILVAALVYVLFFLNRRRML